MVHSFSVKNKNVCFSLYFVWAMPVWCNSQMAQPRGSSLQLPWQTQCFPFIFSSLSALWDTRAILRHAWSSLGLMLPLYSQYFPQYWVLLNTLSDWGGVILTLFCKVFIIIHAFGFTSNTSSLPSDTIIWHSYPLICGYNELYW